VGNLRNVGNLKGEEGGAWGWVVKVAETPGARALACDVAAACVRAAVLLLLHYSQA